MWNNKDQQASPSSPSHQPVSHPTATGIAPPGGSGSSGVGAGSVTVVGETIRIQGTLTSGEEILVNGELSGQLELNHRLTIGAKGKVEAGVKAKEVIIAGSIKGNVDAAERITLRAGANLVGDVKTAGIVIEDGAYFKGGIDITRPATPR
jgi:cytoskeletal protein CcmA (bactofilin family)